MKNINTLLFAILMLLSGCSFQKIILKGLSSKQVFYLESVFDKNIILFLDKTDVISRYKYNSKMYILNEEERFNDSLQLDSLISINKDTVRIPEVHSLAFAACIYESILDGKVDIFNRETNSVVRTIYSKKVTSKLGQRNHDFFLNKKTEYFFYTFLLAYGE